MTERRSRGLLVQGGKVVGTFPLPPGTTNSTLPPPKVPEGTVPLHLTARSDGLAVDTSLESYSRKRWSPRRARWPQVREYDARVARLEQRQSELNAELIGLQEQLVRAEARDHEALARWVADPKGTRPLPTAPAIGLRSSELEDERDALTTAMRHTLDEKTEYVARHRSRLRKEAAAIREDAVKRLAEMIDAVDAARAEVVESLEDERWAAHYPSQEADPGTLRLAMVKGGRLISSVPELGGQIAAVQAIGLLREDAGWLSTVLKDEQRQREETDPHLTAVWEQTDEGRKAINLANKRLAAGLQPKNIRTAGWED